MKQDFKLSEQLSPQGNFSPKIEDETRYWGVGKRYILEDVQETAQTLPPPPYNSPMYDSLWGPHYQT